ncbi:MAG: hypothetical protein ACRC8S_01675 [Fimbriiglobus sp.]
MGKALLWCLLFVSGVGAGELKVGVFAQNINPPKFPISVNGSMNDRKISKVHDDIHARCLVLSDGTTTLALVTVDSCMIPREIHEVAYKGIEKATKIPASQVLISATHTHSAPSVAAVFLSPIEKEYSAFLAEQIAAGVTKAHATMVPAEWGMTKLQVPEYLFNRRWLMEPGTVPMGPFEEQDFVKMNPGHLLKGMSKPAGPTDPEVSVLHFRTKDKVPLALYANYSLHYVGGNPDISADYFGAFCDSITKKLSKSGPFLAVLSNGTSADVNNVNYAAAPLKRGPGEQIRVVAEGLAEKVLAAKAAKFQSDITLSAVTRELTLKVRKPRPVEIQRAESILAKLAGKTPSTLPEYYANETVDMAKYPDTVPVRLTRFSLGDVHIAGIPCETFTQTGLDLKAAGYAFTISLAGGYNGYLPTASQHELRGYETWRAKSSYLETSAEEMIRKTLIEMRK